MVDRPAVVLYTSEVPLQSLEEARGGWALGIRNALQDPIDHLSASHPSQEALESHLQDPVNLAAVVDAAGGIVSLRTVLCIFGADFVYFWGRFFDVIHHLAVLSADLYR